ncbi:hypothetical protein ANCDUO_19794, partial [Ancylostoma duodenale]
ASTARDTFCIAGQSRTGSGQASGPATEKGLIAEKPTIDYVWIGVKTRTSNPSSHTSFSNFDKENPIDGCAVMDHAGVWSIRSCEQLRPFVCQMVVL